MNTHSTEKSFSKFVPIWAGQLISSIGSGLTGFALGIYVFEQTHSATSYSLILLATFLPALLLKPFGGTLADRVNRRTLMMLGDVGSAMGILFIIGMMALHRAETASIYLGIILTSIFSALQNPAYKASMTDFVDEEYYTKASGLMQLAEAAKYLIAPIVAGFLLKLMTINSVLIIDALSFMVAALAVFWVRVPSTAVTTSSKTHFLQDFMEGLVYIVRNKAVFLLLLIVSVFTFFVGLLQALLGPMILAITTAQSFGVILTLSTTGMLVGSGLLSLFGKSNQKISMLCVSLFLNGIFFSWLGMSTNVYTLTLCGFLFFLVLPFVNTSLDVLIRSNVENAIQGRVWSLVSLISQAGMLVAFGSAGFLADHLFGPGMQPGGWMTQMFGGLVGIGEGRGIGVMFFLSGVLVCGIAVVIWRVGMLRELERSASNMPLVQT